MDRLDDKTINATAEAVQHFEGVDGETMCNMLLDDTDMKRLGGLIRLGTTTINPKNSIHPNRVIIDADPNYPYVLIRAIRREIRTMSESASAVEKRTLTKEYELDGKHGVTATITVSFSRAEDENDRNNIVSSFAAASRRFYMELAENLNKMP